MSDIFRFKHFAVDQTGCAMKVNTDGVLLGAVADAPAPKKIIDIGTGTGVIALMLAQRFPDATVDAVEIDAPAAAGAKMNFTKSPFSERLQLKAGDFRQVLSADFNLKKYDLIVSNPPFYLNALHSLKASKTIAKHADAAFFSILLKTCASYLAAEGQCWFILPLNTAALITEQAHQYGLHLRHTFNIKSFADYKPHRVIISLGFKAVVEVQQELVIYAALKIYTQPYRELLKNFLTIF